MDQNYILMLIMAVGLLGSLIPNLIVFKKLRKRGTSFLICASLFVMMVVSEILFLVIVYFVLLRRFL